MPDTTVDAPPLHPLIANAEPLLEDEALRENYPAPDPKAAGLASEIVKSVAGVVVRRGVQWQEPEVRRLPKGGYRLRWKQDDQRVTVEVLPGHDEEVRRYYQENEDEWRIYTYGLVLFSQAIEDVVSWLCSHGTPIK